MVTIKDDLEGTGNLSKTVKQSTEGRTLWLYYWRVPPQNNTPFDLSSFMPQNRCLQTVDCYLLLGIFAHFFGRLPSSRSSLIPSVSI
jgi:hypothetical protein